MSNKLTTVRIESDNLGGNTPIGVNGVFVHLPHNRDLHLTDEQMEALRNSNTAFVIVDGAPAAPEATGGAEGGLSASPEPKRVRKPTAPKAGPKAPKHAAPKAEKTTAPKAKRAPKGD